ncbi:MAG: RNA polymerase sigma factor [Isosphaeraceae bacterium]
MRTGHRSGIVLGQIQRLFGHGTVSGLSEGQLLARFVGDRDEVAFEAIVSRHGPMVLGICRRLLDDPHDVEDAFQATFLVLVKKARMLRDRDLLASWLYGVALRVATRSRRDRTRRRSRERSDIAADVSMPADDIERRELWSVLDAEVARLPARFRTPIVLCYFEGLTHDQAAERIGCPVGTVRSRMSKGRELLQSRLTRRGLAPTPTLLGAGPISGLAPAVPPALFFKTLAGASVANGHPIVAGIVSTSAITLTQGVLRTMSMMKWMTLASAVMVLGALGGGIGVAARQQSPEPARKKGPAQAAQSPANPTRKVSSSGEVVAVAVGPDSSANPVRKALKTAEDGINAYEKQLNAAHLEIVRLNTEIALLKTSIKTLESRLNAQGPGRTTSSNGANPTRSGGGGGAGRGVPGEKEPPPDAITMTKEVIVSRSAAHDRVLIYVNKTGASSSYRPPAGAKVSSTSVLGNYVSIFAVGPGKAQLAVYDFGFDNWSVQDLRTGSNVGDISFYLSDTVPPVLAPRFLDSDLVQLAVFDFKHSRWAVQDLVEPWHKKNVSPIASGNQVVYVLGRHVYAYSAEAGRWDTLTLEKPLLTAARNLRDSGMNFNESSVAVSQDGRLHVFTAKTGRWQTIDPKD